eukprot:scaffold158094_cov24-Prasinocladus_malaysianus.AAC.1
MRVNYPAGGWVPANPLNMGCVDTHANLKAHKIHLAAKHGLRGCRIIPEGNQTVDFEPQNATHLTSISTNCADACFTRKAVFSKCMHLSREHIKNTRHHWSWETVHERATDVPFLFAGGRPGQALQPLLDKGAPLEGVVGFVKGDREGIALSVHLIPELTEGRTVRTGA